MRSPNQTVGIAIMGVPERLDRIRQLTEQLGLNDTHVAMDHGHDGHLANWWRAAALGSRGKPTHVLILEDDAQPCRDFLPAVKKLLTRHPDKIISFYSARAEQRMPTPGRITLVPHYRTLSDVAVVYPRAWLDALRRDFVRHQDELAHKTWQMGGGADEVRIALRPKQQVWSTVPSLVEHDSTAPSTLDHRPAKIRAWRFIGATSSALDADWSAV